MGPCRSARFAMTWSCGCHQVIPWPLAAGRSPPYSICIPPNMRSCFELVHGVMGGCSFKNGRRRISVVVNCGPVPNQAVRHARIHLVPPIIETWRSRLRGTFDLR